MALERDQLSINIEIDSGDAAKKLDMLEKQLLSLQKTLMSIDISDINKNIMSLQKSLNSVNTSKAIKEIENLDKSVEIFDNTAGNATENISSLSQAFALLGSALNGLDKLVKFLDNLSGAIDLLSDPDRIRNLASLTSVLGTIAIFKGFKAQGNAIRGFAHELNDAADTMERFKQVSVAERIEKFGGSLQRVNDVIATTKTVALQSANALGVFAGIAVARTLSPQIRLITDQLGDDFVKSVTRAGLSLQTINSSAKVAGSTFKTVLSASLKPVVPGVIGVTEEMTKLGLVLALVGSKMEQSENQMTSFAGTVTKVVGLAIGGLSFILSAAITVIGSFIQSVSIDLFNALDDLSRKFESGQAKIEQFAFVVQGFGRVFGSEVAGTLSQWGKLVGEVSKNSTTAAGEVRKSISSLVKEAQILGITSKDIEQVVTRANDVAAASGKNLSDVTQSLISGFVGQSQAALALGVDLREITVAHSQLGKETNDLSDAGSNAAKVQLRLAEFFKQTIPIVGAAKLAIDSLGGSEQKLSQQINLLSTRIGGSATVLILFNQVLTNLVEVINRLPDGLFKAIGVLLQVGSIVGIVVGTFLKWAAIISIVVSVFTILNTVIATSVATQSVLTASFNVMGASAGVATTQVTSLSVALSALGTIIKAQLLLTVKSLGVSLAAMGAAIAKGMLIAAKAVGSFLIAIAPLVIKIGLIVGTAILFIRAIQEISEELEGLGQAFISAFLPLSMLNDGFERGGTEAEKMSSAMDTLVTFTGNTIRVLGGLVKMIVGGLVGSILLMNRALLEARLLFSSTAEETKKLEDAIFDNEVAIGNMAISIELASTAVATLGNEHDIANAKIQIYGGSVAGLEKKTKKLASATKASANEIAAALQSITEANRSLRSQLSLVGASQIETIKERNRFELESLEISRQKLIAEGKLTAEVQNQIAIQADLISQQSGAEIEQLRLDTTNEILAANQELANQLTTTGMEGVNGLMVQNALELDKLALKRQQLAADGLLSAQAIAGLDHQRNLLEQIGNQNVFAKQKTELDSVVGRIKDMEKANRLAGLEGVDLAEEQKKISLEAIDENIKGLEDLGTFQGANGKKVLANLMKERKLVGEIADKKIADADDGGGIDFGGIAAAGAGLLSGAASMASGAFDSLASLGESDDPLGLTKSMESLPDIIARGMDRFPEMLASFVEGMAGAIDAVLAKLPEMLTKILDMLPMIIDTIFNSLGKIVDALPAIFLQLAEALPDLISKIFDRLPELITKIFEAIPQIIAALVSAIPQIFTNILDRLPEILSALIEGLIGAMGEIIAAFIDTFITKGGALKMAVAIVKGIVQSLGAIVTGISKGIQRALKGIFSGFEIPALDVEPFKKAVEDVVKSASKGAAKVSKEIFGLVDIPAAGEGLASATGADDVADSIQQAGKAVAGIWQAFLDALKKVWAFIWNTYLKPIADILKKAWAFIWDNFIKPIGDVVKLAFKFVQDIFMAFGAIVRRAFQFVGDLFNAFGDIVGKAFSAVIAFFKLYGKIVQNAFKGVIRFLKGLGKIVQAAFSTVVNFFKLLFQGKVKEAFAVVFEFFGGLGGMITDAFMPLIESFRANFGLIMDFFQNQLVPLFQAILMPMQLAFEFLRDVFVIYVQPFMDFMSGLGSIVSDAFAPIIEFWTVTYPNFIKDTFKAVVNLFTVYFRDVLPNAIKAAFNFVVVYFKDFLPAMFKAAFKFIENYFKNVLPGVFKAAFAFIENFFGSLLKGDIDGAFSAVTDFFKDLQEPFDALIQGFQDVAEPFKILGSAFEKVLGPFKTLADALNKFKPPSLGGLGGGGGGSVLSTVTGGLFANGGLVSGPGFVETPGEFVFKKSTVDAIGPATLAGINETGRIPGGKGGASATVNIQNGAIQVNMIEGQSGLDVADTVIDEIRRRTLDGEFIIDSAGIRSA